MTPQPRPPELDGCFRTFESTDKDNAVRTEMESGDIKVRRRFTGRIRHARVTVTTSSTQLPYFEAWYWQNCQGGTLPSFFKEPDGNETVWGFSGPMSVMWPEPGITSFAFELYQTPEMAAYS